jgi:hypothetical protein
MTAMTAAELRAQIEATVEEWSTEGGRDFVLLDELLALLPESGVFVTPDELAEALHDAMYDVSHHDRDRRCSRWAKYPNIAASAYARLTR